jgi:hypothetical protein
MLVGCGDDAAQAPGAPGPPPVQGTARPGFLPDGPAVSVGLTIDDDEDPVAVGDTVTIKVSLINQHSLDALFGPTMRVTVPDAFEWISAVPDAEYDPATRTARWKANQIAAGGEMRRQVVLRARQPGWAVHRVVVDLKDAPELLIAEEPTHVTAQGGASPGLHADLLDVSDPAAPGESIRLTLMVRNEGTAPLAGLRARILFGRDVIAQSDLTLAPGVRLLDAEHRAADAGLYRFTAVLDLEGRTLLQEETTRVVPP